MAVKMELNLPELQGKEIDVAIIGGGMSGLYSAWRLAVDSSAKQQNVHVFEFGNRVGGRLETVFLDGVQERRAEVGGMRYIPSWQTHVTKLIKKLGLQDADFPMGDSNNLFYLRGEPFRSQSFNSVSSPYRLRGDEQGLTPDDLFVKVLNYLLKSVGRKIVKEDEAYKGAPTREEWDKIKKDPNFKFDQKDLYQQGFWNVLDSLLSYEAYKLLTDAGGYHTLTANWNAAEAASFIGLDFIGAKYKTLAQGYDMQAAELANRFTSGGGKIWGLSELIKFDKEHDGRIKLTFRQRKSSARGWSTEATEGFIEVFARKLILAMPRHGLERLELHGTFFDLDASRNARQRELIESVLDMPAFKLFMGFDAPWWEDRLSLTSGRSVCDLPIRQTYYFGTSEQTQHSLLMTSYNDATSVSFWKGLKSGGDAPKYISPNTVAEQLGTGDTFQAPGPMVEHARLQLESLHGIDIPEPIASCYKDWSAEPFGAGWFLWKAGVKTWEVMPELRCPWKAEAPNVHICGDGYSSLQGWVEGALNTAEKMLQEHFGLAWPDWLKDDQGKNPYLGE